MQADKSSATIAKALVILPETALKVLGKDIQVKATSEDSEKVQPARKDSEKEHFNKKVDPKDSEKAFKETVSTAENLDTEQQNVGDKIVKQTRIT